MKSTWQVEQVTEKPGLILAELRRVEWFKKNPAHEKWENRDRSGVKEPDEFIEAQPGDDGAEFIESTGSLTLDISDGPEMHPGDSVLLLSVKVVLAVENMRA